MKRDIFLWQFFGTTFTCVLGTLLHFTYEFFPNNFIALFSSVNESTYEHLKLIFFPMFLFSIVESFFFNKHYNGFWCIKFKGILIGLILIPTLFYTLIGIFGILYGYINILIFFVSVIVSYLYEYFQFKKQPINKSKGFIYILLLILIAISFFIFTFYPPKIPLFLDPLTKSYGIN